MAQTGTRRLVFIKWALYGALAFLLFLIQSAGFFPLIHGVRPALLLLAPLLAAFCEGPAGGFFFGLACGLLCDVIYPGSSFYLPFMLSVLSFAAGALVSSLMRNNLVTALLLCTVSLLLIKLTEWFFTFQFTGADPSAFPLLNFTLPTVLYTAAFIPPLYYLTLAIRARFEVIKD